MSRSCSGRRHVRSVPMNVGLETRTACGESRGNPDYGTLSQRKLRNWLLDRAVYLDTLNLNDDRMLNSPPHPPPPAGLIFGHAHSSICWPCSLKNRSGYIRPNGIISTAMLPTIGNDCIEQVFDCPVTIVMVARSQPDRQRMRVASWAARHADSITPRSGLAVNCSHDLSNHAMPLIRYQIGTGCASGKNLPLRRGCRCSSESKARTPDYVVTPAGNLISGISLTKTSPSHSRRRAVQIVQESLQLLRIAWWR